MSRTMIISSWSIANVLRQHLGGRRGPARRRTRGRPGPPGAGSRRSPSRSGSSPMAMSSSRTAASARARSTCAPGGRLVGARRLRALPVSTWPPSGTSITWVGGCSSESRARAAASSMALGRRLGGLAVGAVAAVGGPCASRSGRPPRPGSATGGWSESNRVSLDSQVGRIGRLRIGSKIAASSLALSVSCSSRSRTRLVEDVAVVVDDVPRLVVGGVDELADLLVDDARRPLRSSRAGGPCRGRGRPRPGSGRA